MSGARKPVPHLWGPAVTGRNIDRDESSDRTLSKTGLDEPGRISNGEPPYGTQQAVAGARTSIATNAFGGGLIADLQHSARYFGQLKQSA